MDYSVEISEALPKFKNAENLAPLLRMIESVTDSSYSLAFLSILVTRGKRIGLVKRSCPSASEDIKGFVCWQAYDFVAKAGYGSIHGLMGASICDYMQKEHMDSWDKLTDLFVAIRKAKRA